ncbi:MAG: aldolase/citrate lyase family protein [Firmicutes bacterium]|nr:aldolase/citrate lyase family protein [Bacillota bacterium]
MRQNPVKHALRNGQSVFGVFNAMASSGLSELLGRSGFDFVILDTEHGPGTTESVEDMVRAVEIGGCVPIVRVASSDRRDILKALDAGAFGIQVPMVETAEDVERILRYGKYWPIGQRGLAFSTKAGAYSTCDKQEHLRTSNSETLLVVQVETLKAVSNLDEILGAGIAGPYGQCIDVVFVGLSDLSHSMGLPGQVSHPEVQKAAETVLHKCKEAGVPMGTIVGSSADARTWMDRGVLYFTTTAPGLLLNACKDFMSGVGR